MKRIAWFTTARDEAALALLEIVYRKIKEGFLPLRIIYLFVSREPGESPISDRLIETAKEQMGLKVVCFSARKFFPDLRRENPELWRDLYHEEVYKRLPEEVDFGMLAGYMWIVSGGLCAKMKLLNLHPALPGGPKGSWQEVIWQLISARSAETGVMIHLVTPQLDEGPPLTYIRFPIRTPEFLSLWEATERILIREHLCGLQKKEGEKNPLFLKIREEGVKRELPLIVLTLKYLAEDRITFTSPDLPLDLTKEVEEYLTKEAFT